MALAEVVVGDVVQDFHSQAMVVMLEQDLELVVYMLVPEHCLDLFDVPVRRFHRDRVTAVLRVQGQVCGSVLELATG